MPEKVLSREQFDSVYKQAVDRAPAGLSREQFDQFVDTIAKHELEGPARPEDFTEKSRQTVGTPWDIVKGAAGEVGNAVVGIGQQVGNFLANPNNPLAMADTGAQIAEASLGQIDKAKQAKDVAAAAYKRGDTRNAILSGMEMVGHGAGAMPVVGPGVADIGEEMGSGNLSHGLGRGLAAVTLSSPTLTKGAVRGAVKPVVSLAKAIEPALQRGAESRLTDTMIPKTGANKVRFGNRAAEIAPELLKKPESVAWSREGLHRNVQSALEQAEGMLDEASDARLEARAIETQPIIDALLERRRKLTGQAPEASKLPRPAGAPTTRTTMGVPEPPSFSVGEGGNIDVAPAGSASAPKTSVLRVEGGPLGKDVVFGPNDPHVALIDQAIAELKELGPTTRYEPLRTMRAAYDKIAKVKYNPSITQDFLAKQGGATAAADVTGALRRVLAEADPATAAANVDYSLFKAADDILTATAETERVRPTVGRELVARATGAGLGGSAGGFAGAAIGYIIGPLVDAALHSGLTTKLRTARLMSRLAEAIRGKNVKGAAAIVNDMKELQEDIDKGGSGTPPEGGEPGPGGGGLPNEFTPVGEEGAPSDRRATPRASDPEMDALYKKHRDAIYSTRHGQGQRVPTLRQIKDAGIP